MSPLSSRFYFPLRAGMIGLVIMILFLAGAWRLPPAAPAAAQSGCNVDNTNLFTDYYGAVTILGAAAPVGALVEAVNPQGVRAGCAVVSSPGVYGYMRVYGADGLGIPGMSPMDPVTFKVNGMVAASIPAEVIWSSDQNIHEVALAITSIPTPTPTDTPTATPTPTPTDTPTPAPPPTPTDTPTATPPPTPTDTPTPSPTPASLRIYGYTYRGPNGVTTAPLGGVVVTLFGRNGANPWVTLGARTTTTAGYWNFQYAAAPAYQAFRIVSTTPAGLAPTGAWSATGAIIDLNTIEWAPALTGSHLNRLFFDTGSATATPTQSELPTATPTATPTPTPASSSLRVYGYAYRGPNGVTTTPLGGVVVTLFGRNGANPWVSLATRTTTTSGYWNFQYAAAPAYQAFRIVSTTPAGLAPTGIWSATGAIIDPNTIEWATALTGSHLNRLFDTGSATATPTPASSSLRIYGYAYRGPNGVTTTTLGGVTVTLLGRNGANPWVTLATRTTTTSGYWNFQYAAAPAYQAFRIVSTTPPGLAPTGIWSATGAIIDPNTIEWATAITGSHLSRMFFAAP